MGGGKAAMALIKVYVDADNNLLAKIASCETRLAVPESSGRASTLMTLAAAVGRSPVLSSASEPLERRRLADGEKYSHRL